MIFYKLHWGDRSSVDLGDGNKWESIICPVHDGHRRIANRTTILTLDMVWSKVVDFSWTIAADIVVTSRVVETLKAVGLTGWKVRPTKINPSKLRVYREQGYPTLWEFLATGDGGFCHPDAGIYLKKECKACGMKKYSAHDKGLIVDERNWDGSDFFAIREFWKFVLCTERAKRVIEENGFTNVRFVPAHELRWPEGVIRP